VYWRPAKLEFWATPRCESAEVPAAHDPPAWTQQLLATWKHPSSANLERVEASAAASQIEDSKVETGAKMETIHV